MNVKISDRSIEPIWNQRQTPVIFRRGPGKTLLIRLPFDNNNMDWLRGERRRKPKWNIQYKAWEAPTAWFDDLIEQTLEKYGKAFVIQPFDENQVCAPACWNAQGHHCECSCLGANHGRGKPEGDWIIKSDAFAFRARNGTFSCQLLRKK